MVFLISKGKIFCIICLQQRSGGNHMETMTIKRNGIYIIFPARVDAPIKERKSPERKKNTQSVMLMQKKRNNQPKCYVDKHIVGKKCMHCGDPVWRSDVNYCWDCYKYERFESK